MIEVWKRWKVERREAGWQTSAGVFPDSARRATWLGSQSANSRRREPEQCQDPWFVRLLVRYLCLSTSTQRNHFRSRSTKSESQNSINIEVDINININIDDDLVVQWASSPNLVVETMIRANWPSTSFDTISWTPVGTSSLTADHVQVYNGSISIELPMGVKSPLQEARTMLTMLRCLVGSAHHPSCGSTPHSPTEEASRLAACRLSITIPVFVTQEKIRIGLWRLSRLGNPPTHQGHEMNCSIVWNSLYVADDRRWPLGQSNHPVENQSTIYPGHSHISKHTAQLFQSVGMHPSFAKKGVRSNHVTDVVFEIGATEFGVDPALAPCTTILFDIWSSYEENSCGSISWKRMKGSSLLVNVFCILRIRWLVLDRLDSQMLFLHSGRSLSTVGWDIKLMKLSID